ncbi:MAG: hypothetical protein JSS67_11120 [Bacteroidetes bacterium]|nr:hypothetical protein [Bacteroidota bacterium]
MKKRVKLTKNITKKEFDNGYWCADEIKVFAKQIELPTVQNCKRMGLNDLLKFSTDRANCKNLTERTLSKQVRKTQTLGRQLCYQLSNRHVTNRQNILSRQK